MGVKTLTPYYNFLKEAGGTVGTMNVFSVDCCSILKKSNNAWIIILVL
jgi:hypothetical protein